VHSHNTKKRGSKMDAICSAIRVGKERAAEMLGIGPRKLDMLVAEGRMPKCKIDGSAGFLVADLEKFANDNRVFIKN
jgi:hypothetical protein